MGWLDVLSAEVICKMMLMILNESKLGPASRTFIEMKRLLYLREKMENSIQRLCAQPGDRIQVSGVCALILL